MKPSKLFSAVFAAAAALLILATVFFSFRWRSTPVQLLAPAEEANRITQQLMDALCRDDLVSAGKTILGDPTLSAAAESSTELGRLLRGAYTESIRFSFAGPSYATDTGLARDVTVTVLDLSILLEQLEETTQEIITARMAQATDLRDILDEDNNYLESFVVGAMCEGARTLLADDPHYRELELKLQLVCRDGRWWIVADQTLVDLLCGGL